jgi:hypothetical protein
MVAAPFFRHFEDVAKAETRSLHLRGGRGDGVPDDDYAFVESYCTDPGCDCRRVLLTVLARSRGPGAVISFGFDRGEPLAGPFLDPLNPQSEYAKGLLALAKELVLSDPAYVARLERHYQMVKQKFARPAAPEPWWKRKSKKRRPRPPLP